jgi:hypothetical protein
LLRSCGHGPQHAVPCGLVEGFGRGCLGLSPVDLGRPPHDQDVDSYVWDSLRKVGISTLSFIVFNGVIGWVEECGMPHMSQARWKRTLAVYLRMQPGY